MKQFLKNKFGLIFGIGIVMFLFSLSVFLPMFAAVVYPPGAMLQPNDVTSSHIRDATIVNVDVSSTAAIAYSKLNLTNSILDADVSSTAAIAVSKIATSTDYFFVTPNAQTFNGVKTFGSIPILPASDPTQDNEAARKAYIDALIGPVKLPSLTAYETIEIGRIVGIGDGTLSRVATSTNQVNDAASGFGLTAVQHIEQTFQISTTSTISGINIGLKKTGAPTDNAIISIKQAQGGAELASTTISGATLTTTETFYNLQLNSPIILSPLTTYRVNLSRSGSLDGTNYFYVGVLVAGTYGGGNISEWDGTTWTARAYDANMIIGLVATAGQLFKVNAASSTLTHFAFGMTSAQITQGASGQATALGTLTGLSGLTTGKRYYLQNTDGDIGTTAGTTNVEIGKAYSATAIFVKIQD